MDDEPKDAERRLVAMIEHDGADVPVGYPDRRAEADWAVISALWHPALLARLDALPGIEGIEFPSVPEPREIRVLSEGCGARLPSDYRQVALESGAIVLDAGIDRFAIASTVLEAIEPQSSIGDHNDPLVADFLALGSARWWLRDLTTAMGHADCLDVTSLTREALSAAKCWTEGDSQGATSRLRAAFELLTQAREKFYPVDGYIIDLSLLDISLPAGAMADSLDARTPVTFLATAQAIARQGELDPSRLSSLREAIAEGWADVIGGTFAESDEALAPFTSILWQFLKGGEIYRQHLDDRNVETMATRRFALYPQRPQIGRRFGFRFAVHLAFDAGRFPVPAESKRLWESPDSSHLESLMRPPLSADRPADGRKLPWRIGQSMKDDHVATVPLIHWPSPVAGWFRDLRRIATYSPVLSRSVTLGDYFHMSDRPWEMFSVKPDEYVTPYLSQAVARGDPRPISGRVAHAIARANLDALTTIDALTRVLKPHPPSHDEPSPRGPFRASDRPFAAIEHDLETGRIGSAEAGIGSESPGIARDLAAIISGTGQAGRAGYLVLNPLGISRRAVVSLPDADLNLSSEGPLRAAQLMESGVSAIVDLPPFGFAWVPKNAGGDRVASTPWKVGADRQTLKNEFLEVEIDETTGGIRSIRARGETTARIAQQLVVLGLTDAGGQPALSRMESLGIEIEYAGPALARIVSRGRIVHAANSRTLAAFRQTCSLWNGRATLEIGIALEDVDPDWLASLPGSDPWSSALACRWAWPDATSSLSRTGLLNAQTTTSRRPETPDAIEIGSRTKKTTLLFGGLAHHARHGDRMLDTLLVAGPEVERSFRLGVTLDHEHAYQASFDFLGMAEVVASESGPPSVGPTGWLVQVESRSIAVPRLEYLPTMEDGNGWGIAVLLLETAGRAVRSRIRVFRDPIEAMQVDFSGERIVELSVDGDAIAIDLTPHEMARVEIRLG